MCAGVVAGMPIEEESKDAVLRARLPKTGYFALADTKKEVYSKAGRMGGADGAIVVSYQQMKRQAQAGRKGHTAHRRFRVSQRSRQRKEVSAKQRRFRVS
jgi:hypothetical protein